ncbi:MAG: hypothetical protein AAB553_03235 [Patescibacteria group bacterium]
MNKKLFVGPTLGNPQEPIIFSLDSDETYMLTDQLTAEELKKDRAYTRDNSFYGFSVLSLTKKTDAIILDESFKTVPHLVAWIQKIYRTLGLETTEDVYYAKPKHFHELAKKIAEEKGIGIISTTCFSYITANTFPTQEYLTISKQLNAKTMLLDLSERYNFSIAKSLQIAKQEVTLEALAKLDFPEKALFVKSDGLGGGNNVVRIMSEDELNNLLSKLPDLSNLLIQQEISQEYVETTTTFTLYTDHIEDMCIRGTMVDNVTWYGNIFFPIHLSNRQKQSLYNAAKAAQEIGYGADDGFLIGFDAFITEEDIKIIEINARWLGSTPPEWLMKRLGILGTVTAVSSVDYVENLEISKWQEFVEKYLYSANENVAFSIIPLAFSAYEEENSIRMINFMILGDFEAFAQQAQKTFSEKSFPMLPNSLKIFKKIVIR